MDRYTGKWTLGDYTVCVCVFVCVCLCVFYVFITACPITW